MPSLCVFCQERPAATLEHIVPKVVSGWIQQLSPFTPAHGQPVPRQPNATRYWHSRLIDLKVRAACSDCNSDFFNKIQEPVEPLLREGIFGRPFSLDTAEKVALAAWAYKTALLLPLASAPRRDWPQTVLDRCAEFRQRARAAVGARVMVGRFDVAKTWPELVCRADVCEIHVRRKGVPYVGTQTALTLGHLVLVAVWWPGAAPDVIPGEEQRYDSEAFIPVWPVHVGRSAWPPARQLDEAELSAISS